MSFTVKSYAAESPDAPLKLHELERREVLPDDVLIDIIYTGVCHSDLHTAHSDWPGTIYPVVTGHEIVGKVSAVGKDVTKHKVGDMVAVGCMVDSCGKCTQCKADQEMFCEEGMVGTYSAPEPRFPGHSTAGGYSQKVVVQQNFVVKVPEGLQKPELLSGVAPILCAGITTYSPLRQNNIGKGSKVAVAGLGGLGHMGTKLAKALGAEVAVISRSHKKDAQAKELGADYVISSSDPEELKKYANHFELLLDTVSVDHDLDPYFSLLAPFGNLCVLGHIGFFEKKLHSGPLVAGNRKLSGSVIGGIKETQELLDFCSEQSIIADHQVIPMEKINEAWSQMTEGDVANRFVIDIANFK